MVRTPQLRSRFVCIPYSTAQCAWLRRPKQTTIHRLCLTHSICGHTDAYDRVLLSTFDCVCNNNIHKQQPLVRATVRSFVASNEQKKKTGNRSFSVSLQLWSAVSFSISINIEAKRFTHSLSDLVSVVVVRLDCVFCCCCSFSSAYTFFVAHNWSAVVILNNFRFESNFIVKFESIKKETKNSPPYICKLKVFRLSYHHHSILLYRDYVRRNTKYKNLHNRHKYFCIYPNIVWSPHTHYIHIYTSAQSGSRVNSSQIQIDLFLFESRHESSAEYTIKHKSSVAFSVECRQNEHIFIQFRDETFYANCP